MKYKSSGNPIVYSTDKNFRLSEEQEEEAEISAADQRLKVKLDAKNRGGKAVTIVEGFTGKGSEVLGKQLKTYCGTGGSVKDGLIIVQGDNRIKIREWLLKNGFSKTT